MDVFPGWSMAELAYLGQTEERCQITTGEKKNPNWLHSAYRHCEFLNITTASCSTTFDKILLQDATDTKNWHFKTQKHDLW